MRAGVVRGQGMNCGLLSAVWWRALGFVAVWLALGLVRPSEAASLCDQAQALRHTWVVAVCEHDDGTGTGLVGLHVALESARGQARAQLPKRGADLWREHQAWLIQRDACGTDSECVEQAYLARLTALSTQLSVPTDTIDARAARMLQEALARQRKAHPGISMEKALQPFALRMKTYSVWRTVSHQSEKGFSIETLPARWPARIKAELRRVIAGARGRGRRWSA